MRTTKSRTKSSGEERVDTASRPLEVEDVGVEELQALIAARAYKIYQERGDAPGDDLSDWLAAEKEVMASPSAPKTSVGNVVLLASAKKKRSSAAKLTVASSPSKRATKTKRERKTKEKSE